MTKRTRPEDTTYAPCCDIPECGEDDLKIILEEKIWKYLSKQAALADSKDRKRICNGIIRIIDKELGG